MEHEVIKKIKNTNDLIIQGANKVGWVYPLLTGTSIFAYALSTISANLGYASLVVPVITISCYYLIGKAHEEEEGKK